VKARTPQAEGHVSIKRMASGADDKRDERGLTMQTHDDYDGSAAFADLRKLAEEMTARGENLITAGAPFERMVMEQQRGGFLVRQLPDDPLAFRISIGAAHDKRLGESAYLVFRGDPATVRRLLERALAAMTAVAE